MTWQSWHGDHGGVWWLEQALADEVSPPCPPLTSSLHVDVCIVGGGYTGLWTAIEIREQAPDVTVVLIERETCGLGASGRNGGWATSWYQKLDELVATFGVEQGLRLADRSSWAIDRIESFSAEHGINCQLRRRGALWTATTEAQLGRWDRALAACQEHGRDSKLRPVDAAELQSRTGSPILLGGVEQTDGAAVQPALLVRGLRRVAIQLGVQIYESTPMLGLDREGPIVTTPAARIKADRVVLAIGAWNGSVRELRRAAVPIGSNIVLTEPIPDLGKLEWSGGELLKDSQLMVHYSQVTEDRRIAFGRGGGAIGFAGHVSEKHFYDPVTLASIADDFRRWFPALTGVRLTHGWGGPVDYAPGHLPFTGRLGREGKVLYGFGYSGNGTAPSALIGRTLGRQALGISDEDTASPLTRGPSRYFYPEPVRSLGGTLVRGVIRRGQVAEELGRKPSLLTRTARRLVDTAVPARLEPRLWAKWSNG
jgi:glycine/D-amino acid oxidase-like deaminating enzyme